jgi:RimJ/RimL family protein N-acetyltransferase
MTMPDEIDTAEVRLVRWRPSLATGLASAFAMSETVLREWMPSASAEQADSAEFVEACEAAFDLGVSYAYAVMTDEIVGYCNATPNGDWAEIAYWIRSDLAGRGLGTTTAQSLTAAVFASLPDVMRVEAHVDRANDPSCQVARKSGYQVLREVERIPRTSSETATELIFAIDRTHHEH